MALKDKLNEAMNDEVEVDFSGAGEGGGDFGLIENGDYEMVVSEATVGQSKAGNTKVVVQFKIVEGETNAGRIFFRHCPTTGKGSGILRDTARALGVDVDDKAKKFKPSSLVGLSCINTVAMQKDSDEYQEIKKSKALPAKKVGGTAKRAGSKLR